MSKWGYVANLHKTLYLVGKIEETQAYPIGFCFEKKDAKLCAHAPEMYDELRDTMNVIRKILSFIPEEIDTHDLAVQSDLIDDLLRRIDGEQEAQS